MGRAKNVVHKPDVEIAKFVTKVEGIDEVIETPVSGADKVSVKIPESSNYVMTIHFKAKTDLKDFRYKQVVKRKGITVKNREVEIGDYAASDEVYLKEFPQDSTPGGFLIRGVQCQIQLPGQWQRHFDC